MDNPDKSGGASRPQGGSDLASDDSPSSSELPRHRYIYCPPRPVASLVSHETLDMRSVRLAPEIDPRRARTVLSLRAVPIFSRPKSRAQTAGRRWSRVPTALLFLALAVLPGAIVWWLRTYGPLAPETQATDSAALGAPTIDLDSPGISDSPNRELPSSGVAPENAGENRDDLPEHAAPPLTSAAGLAAAAPAGSAAADRLGEGHQ